MSETQTENKQSAVEQSPQTTMSWLHRQKTWPVCRIEAHCRFRRSCPRSHGNSHIAFLDLIPTFVFGYKFKTSQKHKQLHYGYREKPEYHPQGMRQQLVNRPFHSLFPFPVPLPLSPRSGTPLFQGPAIPILQQLRRFRLLRNCPAGNF